MLEAKDYETKEQYVEAACADPDMRQRFRDGALRAEAAGAQYDEETAQTEGPAPVTLETFVGSDDTSDITVGLTGVEATPALGEPVTDEGDSTHDDE